jgi:carbamoyl-phosphate synthase/aspartate carbamoyltransferase/dihydroorotase
MNSKNNLIKLPGLVDVHVHLREPGATQKEDFQTGTRAAIAGGYTQILDMPNNIPPTITPQALEDKIKRAKGRIWCDLGFNFGATPDSIKYFPQISQKAFGLKVYMNQTTGTLLIDKYQDRDLIFKSWNGKLPIMIHAEGETVKVAIKLAKKYKKAIHICHITDDQINAIETAKRQGVKITCEVCPHHLFLTKEDIKRLGPLAMMKPPLLSKRGQKILWENIGKIDMISTDHAPHTLGEKADQTAPKFGVPGLETTLPLMLTAVKKELLSIKRLVEMTSTNPRKIFHLPAQPNTFVIIDPKERYKISNKGLFTKCGWTPFVGLEGKGIIKKVVLRGQTVFENGKFVDSPYGKVIYPN